MSWARGRNQHFIIDIVMALGYVGNEPGMCAGFIHLWSQSALRGEENTFIKRIHFMDNLYRYYGDEVESELNITVKTPEEYTEYKKLINEKLKVKLKQELIKKIDAIYEKGKKREPLNQEDERWLDIKAFCEGIELYQNSHLKE